ncbi:MAG: hypothetical protein GDA48_27285 [Hormoscilla sp. GM102CHS1]|nr:hypothetical protein [Hormoscilla sp. GM102CHS1]
MNIKTKEIATVPTARYEEKASSKKAQENEFRTPLYFHRIICAAAIGVSRPLGALPRRHLGMGD